MICPRCTFDNVPGNDVCGRCLLDLAPLDQPVSHDQVQACLMADRVSVLKPRAPVTVEEMATVDRALRVMIEHNVGALLVLDVEGKLSGIFSERDLLMRAAGQYPQGFATHRVAEFMTPRPVTVALDDSLARALQKMDVGGYRHLPVVANGKPTGMISVRDLVRHITRLCKD
jgi:CBS domain-containing protein